MHTTRRRAVIDNQNFLGILGDRAGEDPTSSKSSLNSAAHLPSLFMSHVTHMPASPDSMRAAVVAVFDRPFLGIIHCYEHWMSIDI